MYTQEDIKKIESVDFSETNEFWRKLENIKGVLNDWKVVETYDFKILENFLNLKPVILENKKQQILSFDSQNRYNHKAKTEIIVEINGVTVNFITKYNRVKQEEVHYHESTRGFSKGKTFVTRNITGEDIWTPYYGINENEEKRLKELGYKLIIHNLKKSNISRCYLVNIKESLEKLNNCSKLDFFNLIDDERAIYFLKKYEEKIGFKKEVI